MIKKSLLFVASFAVLFAANPVFALPEKDTGNLGEIRQSILKVEDFQRIYGDGWVLMDGRELADDDDLFREGLWPARELPDARGIFLRSANHGRNAAEGNPYGNEQQCGAYMKDEIVSHNHLTPYLATAFHQSWGEINYAASIFQHGPSTASKETSMTGGAETRPRCVIVNTFIKVKRTPQNQQLNQIMQAIEDIPRRIVGSDAFRQLAQRLERMVAQPQLPAAGAGALPALLGPAAR